MKKLIALLATTALALSFTSVAGASMAPVTTSKAPTVVSFKVTPNHLPATGGVVTLVAKVKRATTCTFAGDGTLTLRCASGKAEATVTVAPNRLSVPKVFSLTLVLSANKYGAAKKQTVILTEASLPAAPTTTTPPTTTPPTTLPAAPSTQLTGPGKFTFPSQDENGIASITLNAVTQGVPCPDSSMFGGCDATPAQQIDDVNISACAGPSGATDIGFGVPGELSLDLTNATQASKDNVTDDSSVSTAFGNYATLAPGQCVTGDVYFDVTSGAQWLSLNYSYTGANFQNNAVYVWAS